jgi:outer membrane lipoprotein-sorting protein
MRRALILMTVVVALAAAVLPVRISAAADDAELNRILAKMEAAGRSIKTFQATVDQVKRDKVLNTRDTSSGTIYYKAATPGNERVLFDYIKPKQTVSVVGNDVQIYQPVINQLYKTTRQKQSAKNANFSFLGVGYSQAGAQLREKYTITLLGPETVGSYSTTLLQLRPKQPDANSPRSMKVWVDDKTGLPVKYVLSSENEETTVTLTNIQTNPNLPDSKFELKVPSGVRTVEG